MKQLIVIFIIVFIIGIIKMKLTFNIVSTIFTKIYLLYLDTTKVAHNRRLLNLKYQQNCKKILNIYNVYPKIYGKFIKKPKLVVCNHHSFIDPGIMKYIDPNVLTIAKHDSNKEFFLSGMLSELIRRWGTILYKRGSKNSGTIVRKLIKYYICHKNESILVYPEGKTYPDGPPRDFFPGSLIVAYKNNIPVQPMVIKYSQDISWTNQTENPTPAQLNVYKNMEKLLKSNTIALVDILDPIYPKDFKNHDDFIKYIRLKMLKSWTNLFYKLKRI
jgi:1-acyl-sn-glycerol-3-phosphate acyltransferase